MTDIPASLETTAIAEQGVLFRDTIESSGDEDWIAVSLEAGETYSFFLRGFWSGEGTLVDPFIKGLYDSEGNSLGLSDDDGAGDRESLLVFQPDTSGTYYISAGGWSSTTGSYSLLFDDYVPEPLTAESGVPIEEYAVSGNSEVDSLLTLVRYSELVKQGPVTVTYSIPQVGSQYSETAYGNTGGDGEPWNSIGYLTDTEAALFEDALAQVASFANIEFEKLDDNAESAGTIRPAWTGLSDEDSSAWAYTPSSSAAAGDIWFLSENLSSGGQGSFFHHVMIHELGHALGLKHPFDTDGSGVIMSPEFDGLEYTVMTYNTSVTSSDIQGLSFYPTTFMYYDILAFRHIYGEIETAPGNTVYTFEQDTRYYETIWDTGGIDTFDASAVQTEDLHLNLTPGSWSDVGTAIQEFRITSITERELTVFTPEEVTIERAFGGAGNDTLTGNDAANLLGGNAGADTLEGMAGNDTLRGNAGRDKLIGGSGDDQLWAGEGDLSSDTMEGGDGADVMAGGAGNDLLIGGEKSDVLYGGSGADTLHGGVVGDAIDVTDTSANYLWAGSGDDAVFGAEGDDAMGGGSGSDRMVAGAGDDTLYAGVDGDDTLTGGAGNDLIYGSADDDRVTGDAGNDLLFGGDENDTVSGGSGDDTLYGGAGNDILTGGAGDDYMGSGAGQDVFVFEAGSGDDTVTGFSLDQDALDLSSSHTDFVSVSGVQAAATDVSGGVLLDLGGGDSVMLLGLSLDTFASETVVLS